MATFLSENWNRRTVGEASCATVCSGRAKETGREGASTPRCGFNAVYLDMD